MKEPHNQRVQEGTQLFVEITVKHLSDRVCRPTNKIQIDLLVTIGTNIIFTLIRFIIF